MIRGQTIVVGVAASIAAYKTLKVIKKLRRKGASVHVMMTSQATRLVDPQEFKRISDNPVHLSLFSSNIDYQAILAKKKPFEHILLADIADLILICPATANILAKVATGIADDIVSTSILASSVPVLFCPAMNVKMWENRVTKRNVATLKQLGYHFVDPEYGLLACGYKGIGRLAECSHIIDQIDIILAAGNRLKGKKVVVTAGATVEFIDPVRLLTNRASGKMGKALAEVCNLYGADTVLIRGKQSYISSYHFKEIVIETGSELFSAIKKEVKDADIVIHTAAVVDFIPKKRRQRKVKGDKPWTVELVPVRKILDQIKKFNPRIFLVGFKAEYKISQKELICRAYQTLKRSGADLIVANDVGRKNRGFAVDTNEVYVVDERKRVKHLPLAPKQGIAKRLIDYIISEFI